MNDSVAGVRTQIRQSRVIPIVTLDDADSAILVARALAEGGLNLLEITFRTPAAAESIRMIRHCLPEMLVGAGTILNADQLESAIDAGSRFILSPGFNPAIVDASLAAGVLPLPGVNTPTDIEQAMSLGLTAAKFFPAEASGGAKFLKAMAAPYPTMQFVPTGGISFANLSNYLSLPNVLACGGTWIADRRLVEQGRYDRIALKAAEAFAVASSET